MNREIKFRGKHVHTLSVNEHLDGRWIYGYLVDEEYINSPELEGEFLVDENTVGQYTGIKDKNGTEIYEGDIVKCIDTNSDIEFYAVVEFGNPNEEYNWGYQLNHIKGDEPNLDILLWTDMEETGAFIEVVGNIHENEDLLEVVE